jgi:hypothetical protein
MLHLVPVLICPVVYSFDPVIDFILVLTFAYCLVIVLCNWTFDTRLENFELVGPMLNVKKIEIVKMRLGQNLTIWA